MNTIKENLHIETLPKQCYKDIVERASEAIIIAQGDRIIFHNPKALQLSGYTSEELLSTPFLQFIHPGDREMVLNDYQQELCGQQSESICMFRVLTKDKKVHWVEKKATCIDWAGKPAILSLMNDITQRRELELKIEVSLLEKTWGLQTIHHTVQDNLHTLSSLVNLQNGAHKNQTVNKILRETRNRILSLAKIHEYLSHSENCLSIQLRDYFIDLTQDILRSSFKSSQDIMINVQGVNLTLNINQAIACGIILNELVSNAIQHAFPPKWTNKKQIEIIISENARHIITIKIWDNGIGLPFTRDIREVESLGLQLVLLLVEDQLKGQLLYLQESGTAFDIIFKEEQT